MTSEASSTPVVVCTVIIRSIVHTAVRAAVRVIIVALVEEGSS